MVRQQINTVTKTRRNSCLPTVLMVPFLERNSNFQENLSIPYTTEELAPLVHAIGSNILALQIQPDHLDLKYTKLTLINILKNSALFLK